jgi:hypothetical protein
MQRRYGDPSSENQIDEERPRVRIMTREERRKAMEELLGDFKRTVCSVVSENKTNDGDNDKSINLAESSSARDADDEALKNSSPTKTSLDVSLSCSEEGPVCSICLLEYETTDSVFRSSSCPHMFHDECLFSWLERRNNTVSENNYYYYYYVLNAIHNVWNRFTDANHDGRPLIHKKISYAPFYSSFRRSVHAVEKFWCQMKMYGLQCKE